jgi:Fe-S-cluster containining protein
MRFKNMGEDELLGAFCRSVSFNGIARLSLREKENFDCIFWDGGRDDGGCTVYSARPLQCRSYPFWSANLADEVSWKSEATRCPGIGQGPLHSRRKIERWLRKRQADPPMAGLDGSR